MTYRRAGVLAASAALLCVAVAVLGLVLMERYGARRIADWRPPETGVIAEDRNGDLLRVFPLPDGRWRLPAEPAFVDPRFLAMLTAWEDKRFAAHSGVDWIAFARAAVQALTHGRLVSGGSTLTMQTARLMAGLPPRSLSAKLEQIALALALERRFDKTQILSLYLTLAPYGGPVEGVRAASLSWFGKEPHRLTAAQSALLVALPQSPERNRPDLAPERARLARNRVIDRMEALAILSADEAGRARREAMPARRHAMPMLAAHEAERLRRAEPNAPVLRMSIDRAMQERVEAYARERVASMPSPQSLAIMVSDPRSGEVLAAVGGPDMLDRSRQGFVDLSRGLRSPGSTLKPLIFGLAFERGVAHPESLLDDRPVSFAGYRPQNFDHGYEGVMTARRALQLSRNLPAVELLRLVGPARLIQRLRLAGARPELGSRSLPGLAIGLGGLGVTLDDLMRVYGGLANGGVSMPLTRRADGPREPGRRILSPQAAWYVTSILAGGPTTSSGSPGTLAYKTGTSYGYRDAWSLGYDARRVVGVWVGRPDGAPVSGLVGQDSALPILRGVFARLGGAERLDGPPPGILAAGTAALPPPLRKIGARNARVDASGRPEIVFPPSGARVELGLDAPDGAFLSLKVRGGRPPFTWYLDGRPVASSVFPREASVPVALPGFAEIAVIDSVGNAATSRVRLDDGEAD